MVGLVGAVEVDEVEAAGLEIEAVDGAVAGLVIVEDAAGVVDSGDEVGLETVEDGVVIVAGEDEEDEEVPVLVVSLPSRARRPPFD